MTRFTAAERRAYQTRSSGGVRRKASGYVRCALAQIVGEDVLAN